MNVIKALPALVVEEEEIRRFAGALEEVVGAAEKIPRAMAGLSLRGGREGARSICASGADRRCGWVPARPGGCAPGRMRPEMRPGRIPL